jgi:hypothetical protein
MTKQEKREEKFAQYVLEKTLSRVGFLPEAQQATKALTKAIEHTIEAALSALAEESAEARRLIAGAWDENDRPIGLSLD